MVVPRRRRSQALPRLLAALSASVLVALRSQKPMHSDLASPRGAVRVAWRRCDLTPWSLTAAAAAIECPPPPPLCLSHSFVPTRSRRQAPSQRRLCFARVFAPPPPRWAAARSRRRWEASERSAELQRRVLRCRSPGASGYAGTDRGGGTADGGRGPIITQPLGSRAARTKARGRIDRWGGHQGGDSWTPHCRGCMRSGPRGHT